MVVIVFLIIALFIGEIVDHNLEDERARDANGGNGKRCEQNPGQPSPLSFQEAEKFEKSAAGIVAGLESVGLAERDDISGPALEKRLRRQNLFALAGIAHDERAVFLSEYHDIV